MVQNQPWKVTGRTQADRFPEQRLLQAEDLYPNAAIVVVVEGHFHS